MIAAGIILMYAGFTIFVFALFYEQTFPRESALTPRTAAGGLTLVLIGLVLLMVSWF